ncbi:MAG: asparaginase [Rhodoferax sp.]|nr:asparaginase [Rhodoferax sp.]
MSLKVVFLGMGGTIAGTSAEAGDNVGYKSGQLDLSQVLGRVPGLQAALSGDVLHCEQVANVDSKDMEFSDWVRLSQCVSEHLASPDVRSVVITHGTDTLEETAFFLASVLSRDLLAQKAVVLTCAMRPASSHSPDGPQNLLDAVAVARTVGAANVLVVCAGTVHGARDVQKVHPYRLNAFDSGDVGPLGCVEEGRVRQVRPWECALPRKLFTLPDHAAIEWPRVEIVMSHAGATAAIVHALMGPMLAGSAPLRGIVVAGTGNGTVHKALDEALHDAQSKGIRVIRSTRCAWGAIVAASGTSEALPHFDGLSPVKSRIALMLELLCP